MNREDALDKLAEAKKSRDYEAAHLIADEVLCDLLNSLGFQDVVSAWEKINKWYA